MPQVRVSGPGNDQLRHIRAGLKTAPKELKRETYRALQRLAKPLSDAARQGARDSLPRSGGLAERVAQATIRSTVTSGANPDLKLKATQTSASAARFKKARAADKRATRRRQRRWEAGQGG